MKSVRAMSVEELAAFVCSALAAAGIEVILSGGGCVQIWSEGKYVSKDLDFVETGPGTRRRVVEAMRGIGFTERNRYFVHPETEWLVEFPSGPVMVGDEVVRRAADRTTAVGTLRLLTPTDCVKDRLSAFFHWKDKQALEQARLVARAQRVDMEDVREWSVREAAEEKFREFERGI